MRKTCLGLALLAGLSMAAPARAGNDTAVGVGAGAVAGALVAGPIGAVVGAVAGGVIGSRSAARPRSARRARTAIRRRALVRRRDAMAEPVPRPPVRREAAPRIETTGSTAAPSPIRAARSESRGTWQDPR